MIAGGLTRLGRARRGKIEVMAEPVPMSPQQITAAVMDSFANASDERRRAVMQALVRHSHAFVQEVGLTPEEWESAIRP
jgi:Catechol dioxygenase N terminus